jgi:glycine oxidase ThiO
VIIAGAGIIGLSCAWRLSQRGFSVTVFDAREAAREASWAGAGMLAPGGEIEKTSAITDMAMRSLAQYPEFVRELRAESGLPIDYRACGAIEVAFGGEEACALLDRGRRQAVLGIRSEACVYRGLEARCYPDDAIVDPRDITRALLTICLRRGIRVKEHEPVTSIENEGRLIRTPRGEYRDEAVLIAAGAWSSRLAPGLPRTMPVRGHLVSYDAPPGLLGPILRHGHTYLLQRGSGALVAGSSTEQAGFDRTLDRNIIDGIHARASRLLPPLASLKPAQAWNGFRPGIESDAPALGCIPGSSIWTAFGHYRNGILLAPETARIITEAYAGQPLAAAPRP